MLSIESHLPPSLYSCMAPALPVLQIMLTIGRGEHGSTYGGNPVAARVGMAALQVRQALRSACSLLLSWHSVAAMACPAGAANNQVGNGYLHWNGLLASYEHVPWRPPS